MRSIAALALPLALLAASPALAAPSPAPVAAAPKAPALPFTTVTLPGSGVALYAAEDARLPRVWYDMVFEAGERFVPANRSGLASLAAEVLNRGPAGVPYEKYREQLFHWNAEINWEATNRFLIAHIKSRPEHLKDVTELARRAAAEPRLDEKTFDTLKARLVNQRRSLNDDMQQVVLLYGRQKLWDFAPESRAPEGWVESLAAIQRNELFGYLRTRLANPGAFVSAAGPLPADRLADSLAPVLAGWARPFEAETPELPHTAAKRRVVLIDKPGATDNQIFMLSPYPLSLTSREAAAAEVFLAGMGYGLGARLGKTLRVERGLTYHASSALRRGEWPSFYAYSFGGNTQAPKIVAGIFEIFQGAKEGLTPKEVATAKDQLVKAIANATETPPEQMDAVAAAVSMGLPPSYPFLRPKRIAQVTPAEVAAQARRIAGLDRVTLVFMGDAKNLEGPLEKVLPAGTEVVVRSLEQISAEARGENR